MPPPDYKTYARKVLAAARRADAKATEAQRVAQNARTGLVHLHGLSIAIESPVGAIRRGTADDGRRWECVVKAHYGRIRRTEGVSGEQFNCYIGPHPESQLVFVVTKLDDDGNIEEHHILFGFRNVAEAKESYLSHYPKGYEDAHVGEIRGYFMGDFKKWLKSDEPVGEATEKKASMFCRKCQVFYHGHDKCPECEPGEEKKGLAVDWQRLRELRT